MIKSTFYFIITMVFFTTACAENSSNDKASQDESTVLAKEIITIDSAAVEIEKVTDEIEASSKALEEW
jgi:hypothetical protein